MLVGYEDDRNGWKKDAVASQIYLDEQKTWRISKVAEQIASKCLVKCEGKI
jgi:hypothetical protein